jgi:hypothetical protein
VTVLFAILLALGVPFAQLHTVDDRIECCCPSPEVCKCPDHDASKTDETTMRSCHKQGPQLQHGGHHGAFVPPPIIRIIAVARPEIAMAPPIAAPHAPPPPERPDAPS